MNIDRLSYILTKQCNLKCPFCFQFKTEWNNMQLKESDIIKFTDFVLENYTFDNLKISLIGGEPLLYKNFSIFEKVIDKFLNRNIQIKKIIIFTNNTIYNEYFINLLKYIQEKNIGIEYVLTPNLNDDFARNRLFSDNIINIYNKNKEHIIKHFPKIIVREYPVFDKTCLKYYYRIIRENNVMLRYCEYLSEELNFTKNDIRYMTNIVLDYIKELKLNIFISPKAKEIISNSGLKYLKYLLYQDKLIKSCSDNCYPFITEIGIDPDGDIIPCSRVLGIKQHFKYPNINDNIEYIKNIISKLKQNNNNDITEDNFECKTCPLVIPCQTCKILSNKVVMNGFNYVNPKEKCKYELDQFYGVYEVLQERISEFID